ncbi:hypothetical protein MMP71_05910 [Acinetobacter dispersus]|uniref:hypothetical protein n=1 Tax=Acinetobacter dispersus TaxID=70348 RepID=UPI00132EEADD|nr:hypothetical protein [Acinetobacter dispersus]MCH7383384.1 hypothetical protein [Acinetobacter dispersus]QHH97193.1 hypothetical protein FPL17_06360 [Acinetobacter dispersus]
MQRLKKIILINLLILTSISNVFAAQNTNQDAIGLVQRIYLFGDNYFIRLQGPDTCAKNAKNEYYTFSATNPLAKSYYALVLSAAISNKPITIRVKTDCATDGQKEILYIFQDFN